MEAQQKMAGHRTSNIEFLKISKLCGQHLSIPMNFLRGCGLTGIRGRNQSEYFALFREGQVLLAVPLRKDESIADAERKIKEREIIK